MVPGDADNKLAIDQIRLIVESAPNAMLMVDQTGQILLVNSHAEKLFGYAPEALLGQSVDVLVPERFRGGHPRQRAAFFERPASRAMGEGRKLFAVRRDGREFPVEIGLSPVQTEAGTLVLSTIIDITKRRRLEQRVRLVVEAAPNAMLMVDHEGRILMVNQQTEQMFGYDREELINQTIELLVPQRFRDEHPRHRKRFFEQPSSRAMGAGRDLFGVRKDGSEFPVEIGLNPVKTSEGVLVLSAIVDITQRKRAERALRESEANLRDALHKLERQAAELQEANQSLAQYAYVVSHDIRAPLRAIRNYADFLREDLEGRLDEEQQGYLTGLAESVDQAEQLVEDLLLLSRVERHDGEPELLDLGDFLRDLRHALQLPPEVEVRLGGDWPAVPADATLLRQIFQNLILNAVKFNESPAKRVEIACAQRADGQCELYVRDNGIGIEPRHHEQVFRVFQRLHSSEEYEGTGIGLAIVKKAVAKLGGSIEIQSQIGQGTTFVVRLPTKPAGSLP